MTTAQNTKHTTNGLTFYITRYLNEIQVAPGDKKTDNWHWKNIGGSMTVLDPSMTDDEVIATINEAVEFYS